MRLSFELGYRKYQVYMIRRMFSENTLKFRNLFYFNVFGRWLKCAYEDSYNDLGLVDCLILNDFVDAIVLRKLKPSTVRLYISYLKVFFGFLVKEDLLIVDPTRKLISPRLPKKDIDFIPHDEIIKTLDEMLRVVVKRRDYRVTKRNYFIIRVAYVTGWRASEALECNPQEDIDWETGEIYLPRAKGGGDGYVYMDMETTKLLKEWYYENNPNGKRLWYAIRGIKKGESLTYEGYRVVFETYFKKGSHRIRASFATRLYEKGVDVKDIQELMRHTSILSTMKYIGSVRTKIKRVHVEKNPFS